MGTTAIKFDLFSSNNQIIYSEQKRVQVSEADKKEQIQNPILILNEMKSEIKKIALIYKINQIVFSTAMHTLIPIFDDEASKMYLWSDGRAVNEIKEFKKNSPEKASEFYQKTGTPIHGMSPFAKILHFKENAEWFTTVKYWIGLKEFLMSYFVGDKLIDYANASATGLFNSNTFVWDKEILNFLDIKENQLGKLVDTNQLFNILPHVAKALNIPLDTKICIGASDGVLASYASYKGTESKVSLTVGTSAAIRCLSDERVLSKTEDTFCYYLSKDYWVIGGASNNGGKLLEWASELFFEDKTEIFNHISNSLNKSPIGANELIFMPYLNGERAPLWDESVRGTFEGISIHHKRSDFIRAICEGILLNLKKIYDLLNISKEETIALSGGFFNNINLVKETATIFQSRCIKSDFNEPTFGGALLCLSNLKIPNDKEKIIETSDRDKENQYQEVYQNFVNKLSKI
ncbi:FGGY family carbohydrate kinase [Vagococcus fluvialis]|uniref:Gluconokinase n=1 Tax=Vagococcus fluvialis TaxID=2738 RepID=A0A7X6D9F3_9ENTE|nr:gluconokinase [Vagococcus fluvialis]